MKKVILFFALALAFAACSKPAAPAATTDSTKVAVDSAAVDTTAVDSAAADTAK